MNPKNKNIIVKYVKYGGGSLIVIVVTLLIIRYSLRQQPETDSETVDQTQGETMTITEQSPVNSPNPEPAVEKTAEEKQVADPTNEEMDTQEPEVMEEESGMNMDETETIVNNQRYNQLFDTTNLANLKTLSGSPPAITGDPDTDKRIRKIATDRGYRRRPEPLDTSKLVLAEGDRHYLQPEAAQAYWDLRTAAAADNLIIWLASAYRNYDRQQEIFVSDIEAPYSDEDVFNRLKTSSIPGYSKHHTGYAIDLAEGSEFIFENFINSNSYEWLAANDYANAKKYGWIPSYAAGVPDQGPDPEPWEFVYVGAERAEAV